MALTMVYRHSKDNVILFQKEQSKVGHKLHNVLEHYYGEKRVKP